MMRFWGRRISRLLSLSTLRTLRRHGVGGSSTVSAVTSRCITKSARMSGKNTSILTRKSTTSRIYPISVACYHGTRFPSLRPSKAEMTTKPKPPQADHPTKQKNKAHKPISHLVAPSYLIPLIQHLEI